MNLNQDLSHYHPLCQGFMFLKPPIGILLPTPFARTKFFLKKIVCLPIRLDPTRPDPTGLVDTDLNCSPMTNNLPILQQVSKPEKTRLFRKIFSHPRPLTCADRRTEMACAAARLQTQSLSNALLPLLGAKTGLASNVRGLRRFPSTMRLSSSIPHARRGSPFREVETASRK